MSRAKAWNAAVAAIGGAAIVLSGLVLASPAGAANSPPANASPPVVNDTTPHDLDRLTAYPGSWTGTSPLTFGYEWLRCDAAGANCGAIVGATASTHTVVASDVGATLAVRVTGSNAYGSAVATSPATSVVGAAAPVDRTVPTISGVPAYAAVLTASPGTWTGTAPITFSYKWKRCDGAGANCGFVAGATSATYTVAQSDASSTLRVSVTATNAGGLSSALSAATAVVPPVLPANTAPATIGDTTPHDRDVLNGYTGSWTGTAPIAYADQWLRCDAAGGSCVPIAGATASTYAVVAVDVGSTLVLQVTATNAAGSTAARSAATSLVGAAAPVNTTVPTISGVATYGAVLTATPGTWTGTAPVTFSYKWKRCDAGGANCNYIASAISPTYTVGQADANRTLRVAVTATNAGGTAGATSAPTGVVGAVPPASTAPPTIGDTTPHDLDVLTSYRGSWTGTAPITFSYQWRRCDASGGACAAIDGATASTYPVRSTDVGSTLRLRVTATNAAGSTPTDSAPTSVVDPAPPVALTPAVVSGVARDFETLSATTGTWSGTAPIVFAYRWLRCDAGGANCVTITGATGTTYSVTSADVGRTVRVSVNATNVAGLSSTTSTPTPIVAAVLPSAGTPPTLTGTAEQGLALSASTGTWTGTTPISYAYQWLRCDADGNECTSIAGATAASYALTVPDAGVRVRVTVTATNPGGSTPATSAASAVVAPLGPVLFSDGFDRSDGLVTNQYAYFNRTHPDAVLSPDWTMSNGSLFVRSGTGWTGVPDAVSPDGSSSNGTGSAVFRLRSKRTDFANVAVSFSLLNNGLVSTPATPPTDWDGVHVWVRYVDERTLYAVSVNRRDSTVRIKKKCPGGPSNGGVYYDLAPTITGSVPYGTWQHFQVTVETNADGSVTVALYREGELVQRAVDTGVGCAPITGPGAVGVRGDNDDFQLDDLVVRGI